MFDKERDEPIPPDAAFANDEPLGWLPEGKLNVVENEAALPDDLAPDPGPKE